MIGRDNDQTAHDDLLLPDAWPAWLWIGLGALIYVGAPQLYDPLSAAAYFFIGAWLALAVLGSVTCRFNRMMAPVLADLLPGDSPVAPWLIRALNWLVLGMEAVAVMHLSRIAVIALAP